MKKRILSLSKSPIFVSDILMICFALTWSTHGFCHARYLPKELELTSDDAVTSTHYLDLDLEIVDEKINYNLYDKRDAFGFKIVNFPNLSGNIPAKQSYGVFASQLIRYARCCQHFRHLAERSKLLIDKLTNQGFQLALLNTVFEKFFFTY